MIECCIAICTYRRPEISATFKSLSELEIPANVKISIVVADNDETTSAKEYIEASAKQYQLDVTYIHAPARNISIARNAGVENRSSDLFLTIDDDQLVSKDWLSEMLRVSEETNADIVFGPVKACYRQNAPKWIKNCDFHSHKPVFVNSIIETGYTGNTLIKFSSPILNKMRFDLVLGRSGGEDTDFFSRAYKNGANLQFAENAVVLEPVPDTRDNFMWLVKRKFRIGQTYAQTLYEQKTSTLQRIKLMLKAVGKFVFCILMSLITVFHPEKKYKWFIRGCLHIGVVAKFFGKKNIEQY